jgi:hypothetical protein
MAFVGLGLSDRIACVRAYMSGIKPQHNLIFPLRSGGNLDRSRSRHLHKLTQSRQIAERR